MKKLTFLIFIFSTSLCLGQSIELDHTQPSLKISNSGDLGFLLNYEEGVQGEEGFHFKISNKSGAERIHLFGGNGTQEGLPSLEFMDFNGHPTIQIHGQGYGASQILGRIITDQLEIKAGSDLAEYFDVTSENILPGYIACIDPENPGKLNLSETSYDQKVVGIVSGANGLSTGMFMGQTGSIADGSHPIALTGRAYVYASKENGIIQPGDFFDFFLHSWSCHES